jgi:hypothetical protein
MRASRSALPLGTGLSAHEFCAMSGTKRCLTSVTENYLHDKKDDLQTAQQVKAKKASSGTVHVHCLVVRSSSHKFSSLESFNVFIR